ncbi:hypothetical protein N0B44_18100 [Roseibacterium beibuensis]|uniref:hypothetical protein n=1 Tax=[Roseibacterium] beibuensis TaxID=1193142 RepID=UPI00217E9823|nr:hypothetical protein [Roseibacterium beibuensis]MCS6624832.1 hypothetical protein [Roseibacterium beibuensis]
MGGDNLRAITTSPRLGRWKALVLVLSAIVGTHAMIFGVGALPIHTGLTYSYPAANVDLTDYTAPPGYVRVKEAAPGRRFHDAGIRVGDAIRFDRPRDLRRTAFAGEESMGVSIIRDGRSTHAFIPMPPATTASWLPGALATALLALFMVLAGGLIASRARQASGVLLGATMVAMGMPGSFPYEWENLVVPWFPVSPFWLLIQSLAPIGILAFAMMQRAKVTGRDVTRPWRAMFAVYAATLAATWLADLYTEFAFREVPVLGAMAFLSLVHWSGPIVACGLLVQAASKTAGQDRTRLGFLAAALGFYFIGQTFIGFIINMSGNDFSLGNPLAALRLAISATGVGIFLYAMLRHRVVDLGFAVNRTLIYGVLSTTLLLAFFFLEWGAEQIVPAGMREANMLMSAGIAFGLFVVFHRVRDWVEKGVETLFFRSWRDNDARLSRFLKDAAYVTRADALTQSALAEFARYTGGARVGVYAVGDDGSARLQSGDGLPPRVEADHPVMVRLRADREALHDDLPETLGAALVLPMILRTEIRGFALIGAKPSGEDYRPDEREALAGAAQRVGMDIHALEIDRLEAEVRRLKSPRPLRAGSRRVAPS